MINQTNQENPFAIFNLQPKFEIENLDEIYYSLYQIGNNLTMLNEAYSVLKDPIKRATKLCQLNGYIQPDNSIAQEMFIALHSREQQDEMRLNNAQKMIEEHAAANNWQETWRWIQKYSYIKRFLEHTI